MYFFVAEGPMLLSCMTAHKITNFRCKYLAAMATGDNDDDNEDGATTMMMATMATARRARDTTTMAAMTTRLMATA